MTFFLILEPFVTIRPMEIESNLRFHNLDLVQIHQIQIQLAQHKHIDYHTDIKITDNVSLRNFRVDKDVMRPELMASYHLAKYLYNIPHELDGKEILDMGCGSGIQGIIMGLRNSRKIFFSDISGEAIRNTQENISTFNLQQKSKVVQSDLFESFGDLMVDIIVFNHPFFPAEPRPDIKLTRAMMDPGTLLQRFLIDSKKIVKEKIIMPYFDLAGVTNDPEIQGVKYGYTVARKTIVKSTTGLQQGTIKIIELIV